ncbi:uncharacterized protein I206_102760 [Kwoniella pini CBS 10737]|uniref:Metallo-beta-lactamase domain-containing protein n=1 Tax=Kwoniella pini CBS 10737 TaxID=1296096 RepID=A0A1B9I6A5_9TREE|nr:uncharacterized protein I206_03115 [Kwoniella pini CBS 10737]OCF51050.1 hypothetical protein I206_03115 [Kwoniella pini CBS 10737]
MAAQPIQLLFMGTGTSTGLPLTPCLTRSNPYPEAFSDMVPLLNATENSNSELAHIKGTWNPNGKFPTNIPCPCCRSAVDSDVPEGWKNKRGNTGCIVRKRSSNGEYKNLLVDVGKTFREQAARFFPEWGVKTIDAVLLTHGHADAYFGLDDLREWCIRQGRAIPVYLNQATYEKVCEAFPYMVDKTKASGGGDVPQLIWKIIEDDDELEIIGINVKVLAVHHGIYFHSLTPAPTSATQSTSQKRLEPEPLICLGFMFDSSIIYISDVSSIPESTWSRMLDRKPKEVHSKSLERSILPTPDDTPSPSSEDMNAAQEEENKLPILIIDALWPLRPHASHFSLQQALDVALRLKSKYTYLVGSTHPTTHFMWEEICLSLVKESNNGKRNHPDRVQSDFLVKKVWEKVLTPKIKGSSSLENQNKKGLGEIWKEFNGDSIVRPAWDGLVLEIQSGSEVKEVERLDLSTRGLVY